MKGKRKEPLVGNPHGSYKTMTLERHKNIIRVGKHIVKLTDRFYLLADIAGAVLTTTAFVIVTILYFVAFGGM